MWTAIRDASNCRRASRMTRARVRATISRSGLSRVRAKASSRRSISRSVTSMACMSSSIRRCIRMTRDAQLDEVPVEVDPELAAQGRDGPELETADGPLLLAHRIRGLPGGEPGKEPQRDCLSLLVGQGGQRRA